jgi:hypothetical protein
MSSIVHMTTNAVDTFFDHEEKLNNCLNSTENALNVAGYIPGVSTLSGAARFTMGKIQFFASAIFVIISVMPILLFGSVPNPRQTKVFNCAKKHLEHAQANLLRGFIESIPFLGNITMFIYDSSKYTRLSY